MNHSPPVLLYIIIIIILEWRSARAQQFHSSVQDQSTVAQPAETSEAERSQASCV